MWCPAARHLDDPRGGLVASVRTRPRESQRRLRAAAVVSVGTRRPAGLTGAMLSTLRIGDRTLDIAEAALHLRLRGRPPLALWAADLELHARDAEGDARLESASSIPVPLAPFVGGEAVELDVPLKDLAGTSFNVKLYVYEHAPVQEVTLGIEPVGPFRVRLRLRGRSDVWYGPHERDLPLALDAEVPVVEIRFDAAADADEARGLAKHAGLVLPTGTVFAERYHAWRAFLPLPG